MPKSISRYCSHKGFHEFAIPIPALMKYFFYLLPWWEETFGVGSMVLLCQARSRVSPANQPWSLYQGIGPKQRASLYWGGWGSLREKMGKKIISVIHRDMCLQSQAPATWLYPKSFWMFLSHHFSAPRATSQRSWWPHTHTHTSLHHSPLTLVQDEPGLMGSGQITLDLFLIVKTKW